MFKELNSATKSLIEECISLAYWMRGGIQYDDLLWRTPVERQVMSNFLSERLKSESKKTYPNY